MAAVAVVLIMVRMGHYFVAFMVIALGEKLLQNNQSGGEKGSLSEHKTLDGSEGDDGEEQGDEGLDLQLEETKDGHQLLQLLLLATA